LIWEQQNICILHARAKNTHEQISGYYILEAKCLVFPEVSCHEAGKGALWQTDIFKQAIQVLCL
jgi:hypothetical protein